MISISGTELREGMLTRKCSTAAISANLDSSMNDNVEYNRGNGDLSNISCLDFSKWNIQSSPVQGLSKSFKSHGQPIGETQSRHENGLSFGSSVIDGLCSRYQRQV